MPRLTRSAVEKAKPDKYDRREIPDGGSPGLYLIIQPGTGTKSWAMRFRSPVGRRQKLTLGPVDLSGRPADEMPVVGQPLDLIGARRLASEINRRRAQGQDVVATVHRERLERIAGHSRTFGAACLDFTTQYLQQRNRRWAASARMLGVTVDSEGELQVLPKSLADRWGDRPLVEITGDDLHHVIDEAVERGIPGLRRSRNHRSAAQGRALYALLSRFCRWALERRRIKTNPMTDVAKPTSTSKARERTLSDDEIKRFWFACDKLDQPASQCLKLLLLTGCRRDEVAMLRRAEVDGNTITIPASRSKNKLEHVITLPPVALEILASVKTTTDLVFTGKSGRPLGPWSRVKARLDELMRPDSRWVLHDLRRVFSTGCNELGIEPHVVEAALNHISGHKANSASVYNKATYAEKRAAALDRWSKHVAGLVEGKTAKKIVAFKGKRT